MITKDSFNVTLDLGVHMDYTIRSMIYGLPFMDLQCEALMILRKV